MGPIYIPATPVFGEEVNIPVKYKHLIRVKVSNTAEIPIPDLDVYINGAEVPDSHQLTDQEGWVENRFGVTNIALIQMNVEVKHDNNLLFKTIVNISGKVTEEVTTVVQASVDRYYVAKGKIQHPDNAPLSQLRVVAYDREVGISKQLDETNTDSAGQYSMGFWTHNLAEDYGRVTPNLLIKVYDPSGDEIAASEVKINSNGLETIDFTIEPDVYGGPSEFDRFYEKIEPKLDTILADGIDASDYTLISELIDADISQVNHLLDAITLGAETGIEPEWLYGLFRRSIPSTPTLLAQISFEEMEEALTDAIDLNYVSEIVLTQLDEVYQKIKMIKVDIDFAGEEDAAMESLLGLVLAWSGLSVEQQTALYLAYITKTVAEDDFWDDQIASGMLTAEMVASIRLNLKLARACEQESGIFETLVEKYNPKAIHELAEMTYKDWLDLIDTARDKNRIAHITGDEETELVNKIMVNLDEMIPTALLVQIYEKENPNGYDPTWDYLKENIAHFDFKDQNINEYIDLHTETLEGFEDITGLRKQLNRIQRVFLLAPVSNRPLITRALLDLNLDTAGKILRIGEIAFVKYYKEGLHLDHLSTAEQESLARRIFNRAKKQLKLIQQLHGTYGSSFNTLPVYAIPQNPERYEQKVRIPGLDTIFEAREMHSCAHCNSVLSPAAYFMDLLNFLDEAEIERDTAKKVIYNETALDLLFERRPDLKHLVLNCENTNTPLSYLDLVNEILENAVAKTLEDELLLADPVLQYRLRGKVVSVAAGKPVPLKGAFVQVFDASAVHDQMLIETTTDRFGKFEMLFTPQDDQPIDATLKVIYQHASLKIADPQFQWNNKDPFRERLLEVNPRFLEATDHKKQIAYLKSNDIWVISGIIRDEAGNAMKDCTVMAWDYDYGIDDLLGIHDINMDGSFEIRFHSSAYMDKSRDLDPDPYIVIVHESRVIYFQHIGMNLKDHVDMGIIQVNQKKRNIKRLSAQKQGTQNIYGKVLDTATGQPRNGVRVTLTETSTDPENPIILGNATTNATGDYEIRFDRYEWNPGNADKEGMFELSFGTIKYENDIVQFQQDQVVDHKISPSIDFGAKLGGLNGFIKGALLLQYVAHKPVGYLVEAWRQEGSGASWLGNGITDNNGCFDIPFKWPGNTGEEEMFFKVYQEDNFIYQTQAATYTLTDEADKKGVEAEITLPYFGDDAQVDTITLKGQLLDKKTGRPLKARIAFWEKDKDFIGMQLGAFSDRYGNFEEKIQLPVEWLQSGTTKTWYYKVFLPDKILFEKHKSFTWNVKDKEKFLDIVVDREQPGFSMRKDFYVISGTLTHEDTGNPLRGFTVEAWDHDEIEEGKGDTKNVDDLLGIAKTDLNGRYEITFESQYFRDHITDNDPDIYFRIYQGGQLIRQLDVQENITEKVLIQDLQAVPHEELIISGTRGPLLGAVYEAMAQTTFPMMFPFILAEEESKLYLEALGISKEQIIRKLNPGADTTLSAAMAYLDFYYKELDVVRSNAVKAHYGLPNHKPVSSLNDVPYLLYKTRMTFDELKALIKTEYVNPTKKEVLFTQKEVRLLFDQWEYINLHRLITFKSKSRFDLDQLDRIILVFEAIHKPLKEGTIDEFIIFLADFQQLADQVDIYPVELLSWFTDLTGIRGYASDSYYEKTVLPRAITEGESQSLLALDDSGTALSDQGLSLLNENGQFNEAVTVPLLNAIQVEQGDLNTMVKYLPADYLTIDYISLLYRIASFSRFSATGVEDYFKLAEMIGYHPVRVNDVEVTPDVSLQFLREKDVIAASGFSLQEVYHISTGKEWEGWNQEMEVLYTNLTDAVSKVKSDPPEGEEMSILTGIENALSLKLGEWLALPEDLMHILLSSKIQTEQTQTVSDLLTAMPWQPGEHPDTLLPVLQWLRLWETIVTRLELKAGELAFVFDHAAALNWFTPGLDTNNVRLNFNGWKMMTEAVQLNKLFYKKDQPGLFVLLRENHQWKNDNPDPSASTVSEGLHAFLEKVNTLTQWPLEDLYFLTGAEFHHWRYPDDFLDTGWLSVLMEDFHFLRKSGILTSQIPGLRTVATQDFTPVHAELLQQALKSKTAPGQWDEKLNQLKDRLREKQRDALQVFLLSRDDSLKNEDDIYARYLIDTEMSAAMQTSRIKQGVSSIQLMVQRIRMGLEAGISFNREELREWNWRKNYRVWEANRKIFLYPENWIEPELRDDKSFIFKQFEEELLQGEVNAKNVEKAFRNYLLKMDEVARLEISGLCYQEEENIYHIFARTRNLPHKYYYRRWIDQYYWTPWEEIQIDIEGHHLIPVYWNRRVWLFWPVFAEKAEEPSSQSMQYNPDSGGAIRGEKPRKKVEIKMAMSTYEEGKWTSKKISETHLQAPIPIGFDTKDGTDFRFVQFKTSQDEDMIRINTYFPHTIWLFQNHMSAGCFEFDSGTYTFTVSKGKGESLTIPFEPVWPKINWNIFLFGLYWLKHFPIKMAYSKFLMLQSVLRVDGINIIKTNKKTRKLIVLSDHKITSWFYEDNTSTFLITKKTHQAPPGMTWQGNSPHTHHYQFKRFYHPFTTLYKKLINRHGVIGLFDPPEDELGNTLIMHQRPEQPVGDFFNKRYKPGLHVEQPYPKEDFSFALTEAYASYNWELFFHAPLTVAIRLSQNQQFEEAQRWFHYIFNPMETKGEAPRRFWRIKPFYTFQDYSDVRDIVKALNSDKEQYTRQVDFWEENPFNPHVIARMRIVAYMKTVVMKYLDNLIAWGDQLFRRDSIETINEATQIYILASQVLGKRPVFLTSDRVENLTVMDMFDNLDVLSNAMVEIENQLPPIDYLDLKEVQPNTEQEENSNTFNSILYFCIPENDKLLSYWETVADRLYKIRNGMNIEGVKRQLKLFEPPIDPGMLVKAAAAGIDIGSALGDLSAGTSHYRFSYLLPKAVELCNDVKALGGALLSALEKKDAEELSLLRATHELTLLKGVREIKKKAIKESEFNIKSLEKSKESASTRFDEYSDRIKQNTTALEKTQVGLMISSGHLKISAASMNTLAAPLALLPTVVLGIAGAFGSPVAQTNVDASKSKDSTTTAAEAVQNLSNALDLASGILGMYASWERRKEDWELQRDLADIEVKQLQYQLDAANIRYQMAVKELENHEKQTEQSLEVKTLMETKYTNRQLYQWMIGQISTVYFQSYQLAYDLAKKAEKAYAYELGIESYDFIGFGYWDSLKKGLLSGEKLLLDLRRLEAAYMEQNKREQELNKHISLALFNPEALLQLQEDGVCEFTVPEILFDMDHPGHYMRRIKSVSLTIPCITGPYTNVNCKLTLLSSSVRKNTLVAGGYAYTGIDDPRFNHDMGGIQSISTSSAQNDSGVFELNFRDERYLPFERAGAVSTWRLELPKSFRQFDYRSISDVILHMNYTARDGGDAFRTVVEDDIQSGLNDLADFFAASGTGLQAWFSLKNYFSDTYHKLLGSLTEDQVVSEAEITLEKHHFPHFLSQRELKLKGLTFLVKPKEAIDLADIKASIGVFNKNLPGLKSFDPYQESNLQQAWFGKNADPFTTWKIKLDGVGLKNLDTEEIEDVFIVADYVVM